ncbi:hypothetical protein EJ05DRAFT_397957 [Pseudovirgaria hyperparasitica]|uniref:Uncharacterized protein n=1 Tax=Pseudovirgaria hyperparasitica TaxID=470096 RepID=A0A6A6W576_9PEZI|nr:uncharacterized protein EJ05DRAFT_397957 [Pseudovirgaria hyperparasitica]KAF2757705.1 hypothetical protein EJ05DRAFT_397957 [Pseudovirgaria hyperparasitica]
MSAVKGHHNLLTCFTQMDLRSHPPLDPQRSSPNEMGAISAAWRTTPSHDTHWYHQTLHSSKSLVLPPHPTNTHPSLKRKREAPSTIDTTLPIPHLVSAASGAQITKRPRLHPHPFVAIHLPPTPDPSPPKKRVGASMLTTPPHLPPQSEKRQRGCGGRKRAYNVKFKLDKHVQTSAAVCETVGVRGRCVDTGRSACLGGMAKTTTTMTTDMRQNAMVIYRLSPPVSPLRQVHRPRGIKSEVSSEQEVRSAEDPVRGSSTPVNNPLLRTAICGKTRKTRSSQTEHDRSVSALSPSHVSRTETSDHSAGAIVQSNMLNGHTTEKHTQSHDTRYSTTAATSPLTTPDESLESNRVMCRASTSPLSDFDDALLTTPSPTPTSTKTSKTALTPQSDISSSRQHSAPATHTASPALNSSASTECPVEGEGEGFGRVRSLRRR